jgi:hypothetical protein
VKIIKIGPLMFFLIVLFNITSFVFAANYRVSGNGMNSPVPGFRAGMSLDVNNSSLETSWLKYHYTHHRMSFISTSITGLTVEGNVATINGIGTVKGAAGYTFKAVITDGSPDKMSIEIYKPNGALYYHAVSKIINRGNFNIEVSPITIAITSPLDEGTINRPDVMIKGTVINTTGEETGVTVNGVVAAIYNNQFVANHVPLVDGSNTITVTATDVNGNKATTSITVNAVTTAPHITLRANIESGIAPLKTYFSISTEIPNAVSTYQMDFKGDGIVDYTGATFDNISFTYNTEGIYFPAVTVTDNQGYSYTDAIAIVVLNKTELDVLLRAKWDAMKTALANQDVEGAVKDFTENTKDTYRQQFTALSSVLDIIGNELGQIQLVNIQDNKAEYEIIVTRNGITYSFPLLFVGDSNGLWKIERF